MSDLSKHILLLVSFLIYSATGIFTKLASQQMFLSWPYVLCLCGAIMVLAVYAILWQQIIRRMPISDAFMWKGTTIIWAMLFAWGMFGETITARNITGAVMIIAGITLYAWADKKEAMA